MDYKRQLGHRIYTRREFLALLKKHRGSFEVEDPKLLPAKREEDSAPSFQPLFSGETCDESLLLQQPSCTPATAD